ncbi:hypothetical protein DL991_39900 [Amycolatopsis sp. WAC 01375]|nr:hypothetical protein DL991_39900 [Amycolatopsis sp. WAC 01375]
MAPAAPVVPTRLTAVSRRPTSSTATAAEVDMKHRELSRRAGGGARSPRRWGRAAMTVVGACAAAMVMLAGTASAHVKVFADGAVAGKPATLKFRVPSELASVTTIRVDVALPKEVAATSFPPVEGWAHAQTQGGQDNLAHVVWTAEAGKEIKPDESRYFELGVGPLPAKPSLGFDVVQTYSDGTVVKWNEPEVGSKEPEFPSAVLVLDAAAVAAEKQAQAASGPEVAATSMPAAAEAGDDTWLVWVLTGVAALAVVTALGVIVRTRRKVS